MEQDRTGAGRWLTTATRGIRFGPDRAAVRAELAAHLEDKTADFQRIFPDMTAEEAEERAVSEMGDPEELGKELARVHRPWLGYLWRASQGLVCGLAAALLVVAYRAGGAGETTALWDFDGLPGIGGATWNNGEMTARELYLPGEDPNQLIARRLDQTVEIEGCRLTLVREALWKGGDFWMQWELFLYIREEDGRFWEQTKLRPDWLTATDSLGIRHSFGVQERVGRRDQLRRGEVGPFHTGWQIKLETLDPEAEWVRLDYGPGEPIFSFMIDLKEEKS